MPDFTTADVERLARLARIALTPDEITLFTRQLGEILAFAREIQAVDTSRLAEAAGVSVSRLRDDREAPSLPRDEVLSGAPAADPATGLITVPRVFTE